MNEHIENYCIEYNEITEVNEMRDYIKNISNENLYISLETKIKE